MRSKAILYFSCFISAGMMIISTVPHMGVSPDSTIYLGVADNLISGYGLTMPVINIPMTIFPPLYPVLLSLAYFLKIDVFQYIRWVNVFLLISNLFLFRKTLVDNQINPDYSILLIASSPAILLIHSMIWTEPFFILLSFSSIAISIKYLRGGKSYLLFLSAGLAGLAWLARYTGIATILTISACLFLFSNKRMRDISIFITISMVPLLTWLTSMGGSTNRVFALHRIEVVEGIVLITSIATSFVMFIYFRYKKSNLVFTLFALYIFLYTALLAFSVCLVDPILPVVENRILLPAILAWFFIIPELGDRLKGKTIKIFKTLIIIILVAQVSVSLVNTSTAFRYGMEYSNGEWYYENIYIPPHNWK